MDTELKCIVHAEPRATVVWKKDGVNIISNSHTQLSTTENSHILLIKGLQETDFGVYVCSAVNYLGETKREIKLSKTPAVVKFIKPQGDSKDVQLTWEVQSKSPISEHDLQYRKKGVRVCARLKICVSLKFLGRQMGEFETGSDQRRR